MKKVAALLEYLYKSSQFDEWDAIFKLANNQTPEEYLEENYPNIYEAFLKEGKPAAAWISIINQITIKGFDEDQIKSLKPESFAELVKVMREGKEFLKKQKKELYFGTIEDEELTEELKDKILSFGITKEVFNYLYSQTQHTLEERIDMYNNSRPIIDKVSKLFPDFNLDITSYETLDSYIQSLNNKFYNSPASKTLEKFERYYDYIWDGKIHEDAPKGIYDTYKGVARGGAKADSKIVAELPDHIIVYSNSKEAAQYWERGAVEVRPSGAPLFRTCTSRIYAPENFKRDNYYGSYANHDMYQIIRKDALRNGEPLFYNEVSNPPNHLITLCVGKGFKILWGGSNTVNSDDAPFFEKDLIEELGEDSYKEFLNIIKNDMTTKNFKEWLKKKEESPEGFSEDDKEKFANFIKEMNFSDFINSRIYEEELTSSLNGFPFSYKDKAKEILEKAPFEKSINHIPFFNFLKYLYERSLAEFVDIHLINSVSRANSIEEVKEFAIRIYTEYRNLKYRGDNQFVKVRKTIEDLAEREIEGVAKENLLSLIIYMGKNIKSLPYNTGLLSKLSKNGSLDEALKYAPTDDFLEYIHLSGAGGSVYFNLDRDINRPDPNIIRERLIELSSRDYCDFFLDNRKNEFFKKHNVLSYDLFIENIDNLSAAEIFEDKKYQKIVRDLIKVTLSNQNTLVGPARDGYLPTGVSFKESNSKLLNFFEKKLEDTDAYIPIDILSHSINPLFKGPLSEIKQRFANATVNNFKQANDDYFFSDLLSHKRFLAPFLKGANNKEELFKEILERVKGEKEENGILSFSILNKGVLSLVEEPYLSELKETYIDRARNITPTIFTELKLYKYDFLSTLTAEFIEKELIDSSTERYGMKSDMLNELQKIKVNNTDTKDTVSEIVNEIVKYFDTEEKHAIFKRYLESALIPYANPFKMFIQNLKIYETEYFLDLIPHLPLLITNSQQAEEALMTLNTLDMSGELNRLTGEKLSIMKDLSEKMVDAYYNFIKGLGYKDKVINLLERLKPSSAYVTVNEGSFGIIKKIEDNFLKNIKEDLKDKKTAEEFFESDFFLLNTDNLSFSGDFAKNLTTILRKYKFLIRGNEDALHFFRSKITTEGHWEKELRDAAKVLINLVSGAYDDHHAIIAAKTRGEQIEIYLALFKQILESFGEEWGRFICCKIYKLGSGSYLDESYFTPLMDEETGFEGAEGMENQEKNAAELILEVLDFIKSTCGKKGTGKIDEKTLSHNEKNVIQMARAFSLLVLSKLTGEYFDINEIMEDFTFKEEIKDDGLYFSYKPLKTLFINFLYENENPIIFLSYIIYELKSLNNLSPDLKQKTLNKINIYMQQGLHQDQSLEQLNEKIAEGFNLLSQEEFAYKEEDETDKLTYTAEIPIGEEIENFPAEDTTYEEDLYGSYDLLPEGKNRYHVKPELARQQFTFDEEEADSIEF